MFKSKSKENITKTLLLCFFLPTVRSARILAVFPSASISHQSVFRPLTEKLAMLGHKVTIITPNPAYKKGNNPSNIKEIDVQDISYNIWREVIESESRGRKSNVYNEAREQLQFLTRKVEAQLSNNEVQEVINKVNSDFDLLLLEAYVQLTLGFTHIFKVPVIQISSFGAILSNNYAYGVPTHPLIYPSMWHRRIYNLTTYETIEKLCVYEWFINSLKESQEEKEHKILQNTFGMETPHVNDLIRNVDILFLNVHPIYIDNQPWPPNVVSIGGIHIKPPEELPKDLKNILDSSKHGVIYFSLGTNTKSSLLPPNTIKTFVNSFSKLPYDVLWKWEEDVLPGKPTNIKISKWFPQSDLLTHPNIKLFITQGGLQSTDESINAAVPLIGVPTSADQWFNTEKYVHYKIGIKLDITILTEKDLTEAIMKVIHNKSYRENILRLRTRVQDQKESALDRAIWWTEYALRNGAKHMRAGAANISWSEFYEIEIILNAILAIFVTAGSAMLFMYYFKKYFLRSCYSKVKSKVSYYFSRRKENARPNLIN